jgi:hypothetical protein
MKGMPPMQNENSRYAYQNIGGSGNVQAGGNVVMSYSKPSTSLPQKPTKTVKLKNKVKKWMTGKTDSEVKRLQKDAVQAIYSAYWFGWPDGIPEVFKDIFAQYGLFISDRAIPTTMVGSPDSHKSTINARGNASFRIIMDAIYPYEGEAATLKNIRQSPIMQDAVKGMSDGDIMEMVKQDGDAFTFIKVDDDFYEYDDKGTTRMIPRWAIA